MCPSRTGETAQLGSQPSGTVNITDAQAYEEVQEDEDPADSSQPDLAPLERKIELLRPPADHYVLRVVGLRHASYGLSGEATSPNLKRLLQFDVQDIRAYPGSVFAVNLVCQRGPTFSFTIESGALRSANGAFSFAQLTTPVVRIPSEEQTLCRSGVLLPRQDWTQNLTALRESPRRAHRHPSQTPPLEALRSSLRFRATKKPPS